MLNNCQKSIEKAKALKHLNMFITENFENALKQSEQFEIKMKNKSILLLFF
jgi:hypothetical protein